MRPRGPLAQLVHFLLLGGGAFVLMEQVGSAPVHEGSAPPIAAEAAGDEARSLLARTGRALTPEETRALEDAALDEELLYREALDLGLDRLDPVVRDRLVRNVRFLGGAADPDEAYREALALGLDRSDEVVRRRLVELVRLRVEAAARASEPTDAELAAYLRHAPARFTVPPRVRLTQIFLSRGRRRARLATDARALLAELRPEPPHAGIARRGDPFPVPAALPLQTHREIAKLLGPALADGVMEQSPGTWGGPYSSVYGLHLVWVHEARAAEVPGVDAIRPRLREAVLAERAAAALDGVIRELRARHAAAGNDTDGRAPDTRAARAGQRRG
jgi:hypothetical protein